MSDAADLLSDTRDMVAVHRALNRALADAPQYLASCPTDSSEGIGRINAFYKDVLELLHLHHEGEDLLLYPLLAERAPKQTSLLAEMRDQHSSVAEAVDAATAALEQFAASPSPESASQLEASVRELQTLLTPHLDEEEASVLPLATEFVTRAEWQAMPGHAMSRYGGGRPWLLLGLVLEAMPEDVAAATLDLFPPPVFDMWTNVGAAAFAEEIALLRAGSGSLSSQKPA